MSTSIKELSQAPLLGPENFGKRLTLMVRELMWRWPYLAEQTGIPLNTLKTYTQSRPKNLDPAKISAISRATGYTEHWLKSGEGPKRPDLAPQMPVEPSCVAAPAIVLSKEYMDLRDIYARNLQDIKNSLDRIEAMLDECHRVHEITSRHRIDLEAGGAGRQGRRRAVGDSS
jgi:hypothetical protein